MAAEQIITGIVRQGVIVPEEGFPLSEGMQVEIVLPPVSASPELDIWQQARRESEILRAKWDSEPRNENGWPFSFIEDNYGCLADDPLERLPQGEPEVREAID